MDLSLVKLRFDLIIIYLFILPCGSLFIYLFVRHLFIYSFVCSSVHPFIHVAMHPFVLPVLQPPSGKEKSCVLSLLSRVPCLNYPTTELNHFNSVSQQMT